MTSSSKMLPALAVTLLWLLASSIRKLYRQRKNFRRIVREHGVPCLPGHSWVLGDLITVGKIMAKYPSSLPGQNMPHCVALEHPEIARAGFCYIDLWPISWPMLAAFHPDLIAQFTQEQQRPKHPIMGIQFQPLTGMKDLVNSEGHHWKKWRAAFNPGFSPQNVMSLVPAFVEEASIWKRHLEAVAKTGEIIRLEDSAMKATCDVISRAVLGRSLGIQTSESKLWLAMKGAIALLFADWSPSQLPKILNPFRYPLLWYYNRVMRQELRPLIEEQLMHRDLDKSSKTINNLAIRAYLKEIDDHSHINSPHRLEFLDTIIEQLKIFLFAGHDTTSSTLCFAYYHIYRHPDVLMNLRAEHISVFGADSTTTARQIRDNPIMLNRLPYTTAVIKETLRLDPPIGSVRSGSPTYFLRHPQTGQPLPTDGFILFVASKALHRNPQYWTDPDDFIAERWLDAETNSTRRNAFRPFELGSRACIGQELAMTELKMLLAMTLRDLEIIPMYKDTDPYVLGCQAFQVHMPAELTAHPSKGMPVMVRSKK